ncbi:6364_t:CDS:1 [Funneliformis caledonium]|uniref:6364_t:CDS:1 n=1 Tax=Funneliformis caledonium TaxID=1117310 RepID=A0A9N9ERS5_9GLOM|nr:6364_t:CDS:1 [Funneliformis caledonium]
MTSPENLLVCSTAGEVFAINKTDGTRVWNSKLSGVGYGVGALFVFDNKVYVGMNGHLIALNLADGAVIWNNPLSTMWWSEVSVLVTSTNSNSNASSYKPQGSVVLVGSFGKVCGIDPELGGTLWKNELKGAGYELPCLMLDSSAPDAVLVGCGRRLYKINIYNGQAIWKHKLSKAIFAPSCVTMATQQSSLQAAFTYTGFNNNPVAQQHRRHEREKNSGD